MRIVFIAPSTSQPRILKRILSLKNAGFDVKVYAYDNGIYRCNTLAEDIPVKILGTVRNGKDYLIKLFQLKCDITRIVSIESTNDTLFYGFGFFIALFLCVQRVTYIYEISDVLYGYKQFYFVRPIMKLIDKILVNKSKITIMTSEGFNQFLFGEYKRHNVVFQPNKLNQYFTDKERSFRKINNTSNLKFAFIGAIRYPNTILRFAKIIGKHYPNHEFHFFGDSHMVEIFQEATNQYNNVFFHGQFRNPDDLENIYHSIDIVVCCYENESLNERIAEPNKLYEAAFFGKPIIVSKNTFLASQIEKYRCGWAIDAYNDESIRHFIDNLSASEYNRIVDNEKELPDEFLIDNPQMLIEKLRALN